MEELDHPKLFEFGSAIEWLLQKGVSADRLAVLFGTTPGNIRVLAHRARREASTSVPSFHFPDLSATLPPVAHQELGIRSIRDRFILTRKGAERLDWLECEIARRFQTHRASYRYLPGIERLRELLPYIGYPADARRLGLAARLHQHTAWLYFQSGFSRSAVQEAQRAMELAHVARRESGEGRQGGVYIRQIIDAALIASWALLIARKPEAAWKTLDQAHDACLMLGTPPPADEFRQRGMALFQLGGRDTDARNLITQSADFLAQQGEAARDAEVLLWVSRASLLDPADSDRALEHLTAIGRAFGAGSVEYSGTVSWTAAAALATDSPNAHLRARELLAAHLPNAERFGHQATIAKLLSITPELGLYSRLSTVWVRRALYENAFRNH